MGKAEQRMGAAGHAAAREDLEQNQKPLLRLVPPGADVRPVLAQMCGRSWRRCGADRGADVGPVPEQMWPRTGCT